MDSEPKTSTPQAEGAAGRPRVLLIAYDFPPIASAGMYRVTSMARHLTRLGWHVTILTVESSFAFQSETTQRLVPDEVRVERTPTFEFIRAKRWLARQVAGKGMSDDPEGTVEDPPRAALGRPGRNPGLRALAAPTRWIENALGFPDAKVGWFWPLFARARSLIARHSYDVVLTSSPPHSTHLPLLVLRRVMRFRWVVDFRDPWTAPRRGQRGGLPFEVRRWLEKSVLARCDAIIANTPGNKRALLATFPGISEDKIEVITNGFDDLRSQTGCTTTRDLTGYDIAYFGAVYTGMLDSYAAAIRYLRDRGHRPIPRLAIFGKLPITVRSRVIRAHRLDEFIEFKGRVTDVESYELMKRAKSLLLLLPRGDGIDTWVPSKLYTYLSTTMPIFAIIPKGDAWEIIESAGGGVVTEGDNPEVVADRLVRFLKSVEDGTLTGARDGDALRRYSWEALSMRVDKVLRRVGPRNG